MTNLLAAPMATLGVVADLGVAAHAEPLGKRAVPLGRGRQQSFLVQGLDRTHDENCTETCLISLQILALVLLSLD